MGFAHAASIPTVGTIQFDFSSSQLIQQQKGPRPKPTPTNRRLPEIIKLWIARRA
jgi:hypothetical protein